MIFGPKEPKQCPECKAYTYPSHEIQRHSPTCSKNTYQDLQQHIKDMQHAHSRFQSHFNDVRERLNQLIERWQGKFLAVKHENNKLRNALYQRQNPPKPPPTQ